MSFTGKIIGLQGLIRKIEQIPARFEADVLPELALAGFAVQRTAKKSIQSSPAGSNGRSKPGNPPKTDTGRLVNSIFADIERKRGRLISIVGTNVEYGAWLEFGTSRIDARPWLAPAFEAHKKNTTRNIKRAIDNSVRKMGKSK